jgi:hypothetical protein
MTPAERIRTHDAVLADVERLASVGKAVRGSPPLPSSMQSFGVTRMCWTISYRVDLGGFEVRVLSLERLLLVKRRLGRPKDKLMALQIEATLDEQRGKDGGKHSP